MTRTHKTRYLTEAFVDKPIEWTADLKWFRANDGVPSNPRPVFIKTKEDSYKNPGKIAYYNKNLGGWVKKVEKTFIKIQTPKCWTEILTEPAYKMFESDYELMSSSPTKKLNEKDKKLTEEMPASTETYQLTLDYGDAWYDMLSSITDERHLAKAVKPDEVKKNILIRTFLSKSEAVKFKNELKKAFDDMLAQVNPEEPDDLSIDQQLITWVEKIEVVNDQVLIYFTDNNQLFERV